MKILKFSNHMLFADDTNLNVTAKILDILKRNILADINTLIHWL